MNKRICCLLCFLLVASFSLSGCGDKLSSAASTEESTNLIGKWEIETTVGGLNGYGFDFKEDGTVTQYALSQSNEIMPLDVRYTCDADNNIILENNGFTIPRKRKENDKLVTDELSNKRDTFKKVESFSFE